VYEFNSRITGHFDVQPANVGDHVEFGVPYLAWTVKDARGIVGTPSLQIGNIQLQARSAVLTQAEQQTGVDPSLPSGTNLRVLLPNTPGKEGSFDFTLNLILAGTQKLELVPLGSSNHFELQSSWRDPLFAGQFLPRTREISASGFHAVWEVSSLASQTQQQLSNGSQNVDTINVSLANLIDPYRLSDRAVKYGILFVLLTFGSFFLFELVKRMLIHPVQYLLVGFCLATFFLLLVSFSEHVPFGVAYLLASAACIGILTFYLVAVLRSTVYGLTFGAALTALYGCIYGLLISEDNALLLGSLLLFAVIAGAMVATRKIDWYQRTAERPHPQSGMGAAVSPTVPSGTMGS
jgi:inner membrane protein